MAPHPRPSLPSSSHPPVQASDFWVALNERETELSRCDVLRTAWRTADFSRACRRGTRGCYAWSKVSSRRPVRFVCKDEQRSTERKWCRNSKRG